MTTWKQDPTTGEWVPDEGYPTDAAPPSTTPSVPQLGPYRRTALDPDANRDDDARWRYIEDEVLPKGWVVDLGDPQYPDGCIYDAHTGEKIGPLPSFPRAN